MKNDQFLTGLLIGGLVGVTVTLMAANKVSGTVKKGKLKENGSGDKSKKQKNTVQESLKDAVDKVSGDNPEQAGEDNTDGNSKENEDTKVVIENTEYERKEEGKEESINEVLGDNIGEKIAELEQVLKKLREENT
ncbi:MAG: hypothetical protein ACOCQN_03885 [Halanaerobiaceae bacterium]